MNWLRRKIRYWLDNENSIYDKMGSVTAISGEHSIRGTEDAMKFTVYPASGGTIVEYRRYNEKTDRNSASLHIITSDQDLGEGLSRIITLEMLKR
jgi:hypothetical protein